MLGMPNIPNFKGLATAGQAAGTGLLGAAIINKLFGNYWGVFNEFGIPILLVDSVVSFKNTSKSQITNAPIEKGAFASYNKVNEPGQTVVQMSKWSGGTLQRGAFLAQLEMLRKSTLKFHVITPEFVYLNHSITNVEYSREASSGVQLIVASLTLEEIQEVVVRYDTVKVEAPQDAKTKDGGQVQPVDASKNESLGVKLVGAIKGLF